ncbi:haspin [Xylocopa sonorina]|uniref:haspin n=1 Tax=Xylocopa sonorina TaxID=1818115 RepID=UPI00403A7C8C
MDVDEQNDDLDVDEEGGLWVDDIYIPPPLEVNNQIDINGPRLMITKIVNHNFKSYGETQVVGPFHKCFSAIVGPNGSGKSNVIDSMLFVFGYRATRIRTKKVSDLIHNSNEHQNINSCTVSVHFQQIIDKTEMDYDIVPNSEFVISRTAFKDNSSYYELNKKKVQFKEIAKVLKSFNVDLDHSRFLILQGEVEQIAMMKPKAQNENDTGMLEFLEDIIGTVRYKEPLEKIMDKVEYLSDYRVQKLNRLKIVEKEKAALEEPMQQAIQYLQLENEIIKLQYQLYSYQRFKTSDEIMKQETKTSELDKDLSELVSKMDEINNDKEQKNKVIKEKSKAWDNLQKQKDQISASFDKIRKCDESLHAELIEINKRRKANIASLKTEKSKLEELSKVPEKNTKDIEECQVLLENHIKRKEKEELILEKLMTELSKKTEPLLNKRSDFEKKLISLRKDVDQAQAAFNIAQSELELYSSVESTEKEKFEKLKQSLKLTKDNLIARNAQLQALENKIPLSENELRNAQQELKVVKTKEIEKIAELKKNRAWYEEQKSALQANKSKNTIIQSLMREKREGRIPGVFGRLGDLGAIDGKYDIAVSTACGPLDNIVVDTVETAQTCITFLRQNDIGRATFISLEKQQHFLSKCKEKISTPENVPRLFDLIRVEDERVLPAFYYSLQDTLVANDLDQATRIAYGRKRFRVVTLKGQLIELSGTMSGGGRTLKGRMGQTVLKNELSQKDIEKLQVNLDEVFKECNELKTKSESLERQIHTLNIAVKEMKVSKEKLCIEVKTLQEQEPSLVAQLEIQEKKVKKSISNPQKIKELKKAMDAAMNNLETVSKNSKAIEDQVNHINNEIEEISGSCIKDKQKQINHLFKVIDKTKAEICKLQVGIKTVERNVKKTEQRIDSLENDVQTCEQRLRDIQQEKGQLEEQGKEYLKELEQVTEALSERDEMMSSFKEELHALQAKENKMKAVKIDLDQKLKEYKNVIKELKQKIRDLTRRIADLKLQVIPGEDVEQLKELTDEELNELDENILISRLQKVKKKLPAEVPNMQVVDQYKEKDALYLQRVAELEKITVERNKIRDIYETAKRSRNQEFFAGFTIISNKLKEIYQMITLGGDAELELVDTLDPFSEGVAFSVRPPKKSWKNICNLSGGEKTLSSLALVFALHHYKPSPLYFMDEIDAALDFKNVSIIGNYIKERTKNAQFIIVSLRSNMFELADYLVGIYKTYNCTKCVTVEPKKFYEKNQIAPPTQTTNKHSYASQMQKYAVQSQSQHKEIYTAQNTNRPDQMMEQIDDPNRNTVSDLPPLGLCPTPKKASNQSGCSSTTDNSRNNGNDQRKSLRKKHKMYHQMKKPIRTYERKKFNEVVISLPKLPITVSTNIDNEEKKVDDNSIGNDPFDTTFDRLLKNARIPQKLTTTHHDTISLDSTDTDIENISQKSSQDKLYSVNVKQISKRKVTCKKKKMYVIKNTLSKKRTFMSDDSRKHKVQTDNSHKRYKLRNTRDNDKLLSDILSDTLNFTSKTKTLKTKNYKPAKKKAYNEKDFVKRRKKEEDNVPSVTSFKNIKIKECSVNLDRSSVLKWNNEMSVAENNLSKKTDQLSNQCEITEISNNSNADSKHCFVKLDLLDMHSHLKPHKFENTCKNLISSTPNNRPVRSSTDLIPLSPIPIVYVEKLKDSVTHSDNIPIYEISLESKEKSDDLFKRSDIIEKSNFEKRSKLHCKYSINSPNCSKFNLNQSKNTDRRNTNSVVTLDNGSCDQKELSMESDLVHSSLKDKNKQNDTLEKSVLMQECAIINVRRRIQHLNFSIDTDGSPSLFNDSIKSIRKDIIKLSKKLILGMSTDTKASFDKTEKEILEKSTQFVTVTSNALSGDIEQKLEADKIDDPSKDKTDLIDKNVSNRDNSLSLHNSFVNYEENLSIPSPYVLLKEIEDLFGVTKRRKYSKWNNCLDNSVHNDVSNSISGGKEILREKIYKSQQTTLAQKKLSCLESIAENSTNNAVVAVEKPVYLKPGKSWSRSLTILNSIQNELNLDKLSVGKGKKWRHSVQDILNMQKQGIIQSCIKRNSCDKELQIIHEVSNKSENEDADCKTRTCESTSLGRLSKRISVRVVPIYKSVKSIEDAQFLEVYGIVPIKSQRFTLLNNLRKSSTCNIQSDVVDGQTIEEHVASIAREVILQRCLQNDYIPFSVYFTDSYLEHCRKIGEGVYGEVFLYEKGDKKSVIKIIPIEGSDSVNGEPQKKFHEILSEIVIAMELHNLRFNIKYNTDGFVEVKNIKCIKGRYPVKLIELWNIYDEEKRSDNDCPSMFHDDQLYIVLELSHGGQDLEAFVFNTAEEVYILFIQAALALAVAEKAVEFEHRDLHWGNILISRTNEPFVHYKLGQKDIELISKGVKVSIIDFTLSRITYQGCSVFNDLASDPTLFTAQGEYQFEIYRLMRDKVLNNWQKFEPYTNVLWLHYTLDKMITEVRYKKKNLKIHKNNIVHLKELKNEILSYDSAFDFITKCDKISNLLCTKSKSRITRS